MIRSLRVRQQPSVLLGGHLIPDDRANRLGYDRNSGGAKLLNQRGLS
jgi:hypothetical protein